jgi:hypothetical protein
VENAVPVGQAVGHAILVQASWPSTQLQVLQLTGSGKPVAPLGYTTPSTLQPAPNESAQRPSGEQIAVVGGSHGSHKTSPAQLRSEYCCRAVCTAVMAPALAGFTKVSQEHGIPAVMRDVHWPVCCGSHVFAWSSAVAYALDALEHWSHAMVVQLTVPSV